MAFLSKRTRTPSSSSSHAPANNHHSPSNTSNLGLGSNYITANNGSSLLLQRADPHSASIIKRVSTMFTPKKRAMQNGYGSIGGGIGSTSTGNFGGGIGYNAPRAKRGWKQTKQIDSWSASDLSRRQSSSESDLDDLEEIRQPNDLGPPAPSIYPKQEEEEANHLLLTPKKLLPQPPKTTTEKQDHQQQQQDQKRRRRFSIHSVQSLISSSPSTTSKSSKRRSISVSSFAKVSISSSHHSRTYSHSIHSLSQSLLEEAELLYREDEEPVYTATKATKISAAVWAGPTRTTSAPDLSLAPTPAYTHARTYTHIHAHAETHMPIPVGVQSPTTSTLHIRRKPPPRLGLRELPLPVLIRIFECLPRILVVRLAPLSRAFCQACRVVLYGTLDLSNVSPARQDILNDLLGSSGTSLAGLTKVLLCDEIFTLSSSSSSSSSRSASYTTIPFPSPLVLSHMHNLTVLTLPSFSIDLLQHHTAFGLRSVTFLNTSLGVEDKVKLLTWLDGQVNITTLSLPRLFDSPRGSAETQVDLGLGGEEERRSGSMFLLSPGDLATHFPLPPSPNPPSPNPSSLQLPLSPSAPASVLSSPSLIPLPPSPNPLPPPQSPISTNTLSSPSFPYPLSPTLPTEPQIKLSTLSSSRTLLPNLYRICAPPSLLGLIAPQRVRTLKDVGVNINDTLVGGLRPVEIVGCLKGGDDGDGMTRGKERRRDKDGERERVNGEEAAEEVADNNDTEGGIESLWLNFGKIVDRRTVEKVLGAAGKVLGGEPSVAPAGSFEGSDDDDRGEGRGRGRGREGKNIGGGDAGLERGEHAEESSIAEGQEEEEHGLKNLEITIPWNGSKTDEVLYKTIHSVLPRYRALCTLVMRLAEEDHIQSSSGPVLVPFVGVNAQGEAPTVAQLNEGMDASLSPTASNAESDVWTNFRKSSSAESSGMSTTSRPSIVSLTMFPEPPSSLPYEPASVRYSTSKPAIEVTAANTPLSASSSSSSSPPNLPESTAKPKTILGRLPSLTKKKRADTEPIPPLPRLTIPTPAVERSSTSPSPRLRLMPRAAIVRDEYDDDEDEDIPAFKTAVPTKLNIPPPSSAISMRTPTASATANPINKYHPIPFAANLSSISVTPTTPIAGAIPSAPGSPSPSSLSDDRRFSSMTISGISVSSSIGGVDWNHYTIDGAGINGNEYGYRDGYGHRPTDNEPQPPTPRTPMPATPTLILTESEKRHVRMWIRQCPSLRRVVFISGAEWGL
ncbi:hypothetical protein D9757_008453 [Collybiopsis confluens]|uniref:F-box domain-containing protein n=1 Tax=Collybiopsis confluens TaxID=2823264 RepID=A0A8H5M6B7_9AGAR|nr:hypothetical protein D9757_008453 [Collybiopsis confluens]